ncbi:MAG TPA: type 4a pilus biogenesis protein PilO [Lacipirellula sp.]
MLNKSLETLRLSPAVIHVFGGAVVAAVCATFYFAFYAPVGADIADRTARMDEVRGLMASSDKVAQEYRQLHDRVAELRQAAASTRRRMPRRASTQEFIESLTQLAAANKVEVNLCSAAAPQAFPTHTRVEVTCDLEGSYAAIGEFLADVDQLSQISKVSMLTIDTTENSDKYPVTVKFQLYYRAQLSDTELQRGSS